MNPLAGFSRLLRGGRADRRVWRQGRAAHIEVRGVSRLDAGELDAALAAQPGVAWARTVPVLGRVVVALERDDDLATSELVDAIERFELDHGVSGEPFPSDRADHPADREPFDRDLTALVADGLGLGVALAGRMASLARLPVELAGVVTFVQSQPWVRHRLQSTFGRVPADMGLALTNAAAAALSQGPLGLLADAGQRVLLLRETTSANLAWERAEPALTAGTASLPPPVAAAASEAVDGADRHAARPGPAEAYADVAGPVSLLAGASMVFARSRLRRAAAVALAGTPKAAVVGVDAFAAELHRVLADRGVVCFDRGALRRIDRVDSVVVDGALLRAGDGNDADGELAPGARELVDAARRADFMVAVADSDARLVDRLGADVLVDGGERLADSVRMLQDDGCGTLVIAAGPSSATRAWWQAECGLGLFDADGRPPWGAQLIATEGGLENAVLIVEAAAAARRVSRDSAAVALGSSAVGALMAATGPAASGSSLAAVNLAALAAMGHGARQAGALAGLRVEPRDGDPPWHAVATDEVLERLGSSHAGLSEHEAAQRLADLPPAADESLGLWEAFADELANPLTPVLAVAAGLSAAVGSPSDAGLVGGVVGLNALIGAAQQVRVDRAVRALADASADADVRVRRAGSELWVAAAELVPGDIIMLEAGDAVPADCRIIRALSVEADESSLTGESLPVAKSAGPSDAAAVADRTSMLYEATAVSAGEVEAVVVAVGAATEAGRASAGDAVISRGVEERIGELTRLTLPVALAGGLFVTGVGLLRRQPLRDAVAPGVSLGVAAVPEGLPLLATVSELSGAKRLASRGALARNPRAIDTLGRVDVLCVDKTGTLTGGRIELRGRQRRCPQLLPGRPHPDRRAHRRGQRPRLARSPPRRGAPPPDRPGRARRGRQCRRGRRRGDPLVAAAGGAALRARPRLPRRARAQWAILAAVRQGGARGGAAPVRHMGPPRRSPPARRRRQAAARGHRRAAGPPRSSGARRRRTGRVEPAGPRRRSDRQAAPPRLPRAGRPRAARGSRGRGPAPPGWAAGRHGDRGSSEHGGGHRRASSGSSTVAGR